MKLAFSLKTYFLQIGETKVSESKNVNLVSLLIVFQVVRMIKLLRLLGCVDYIRKEYVK
jgi:hypothetical protein